MITKLDTPYDLQFKIKQFRNIIDANNSTLEIISELQQYLQDGKPLNPILLAKKVTNIIVNTYKMVKVLNELTDNKYPNLFQVYEDISSRIRAKLGERTVNRKKEFTKKLIIPFAEIDNSYADIVGEKISFMCDIKNKAGIPVPDGFAIPESAYRMFMEENNLEERINRLMEGIDYTDMQSLYQISSRIRNLIIKAKMPIELEEAISEALHAMRALFDTELRASMRSSALFESNAYTSFAGQYRSTLNISSDEISDSYKDIISSKFTPEALVYSSVHGYDIKDISMCVAVQRMINAESSGVMYTSWQKKNLLLIQSIYGLGLYLVNGSVIPDTFIYDKNMHTLISTSIREKPIMLKCDEYGTKEEKVAPGFMRNQSVDNDHIIELFRIGRRLEKIYGTPLDIEWVIDNKSNIYILQCRAQFPETLSKPENADASNIDIEWAIDENGELYVLGYRELDKKGTRFKKETGISVIRNKIISDGKGITASSGTSAGTAFNVDTSFDIMLFPPGGIIISKTADPRLAILLKKASGIISLQGHVTAHLATVARELNIPSLFGVPDISIENGTIITLDASNKVIYEGRVERLLNTADEKKEMSPTAILLRGILKDIAALNVPNPVNSNTQALKCRTIHDIVRFVHQTAIEEMFKTCDNKVSKGCRARTIITPVPMNLIAFDLGEGIAEDAPENNAPLKYVLSIPMQALWRGMIHKGIKWSGERNINVSGLISAMTNYLTDESTSMRGLGSPSYVFISKNYLNLNSRVGYHFATVDAYIGEHHESNYINFRFSGGANALDRRSRRTALIEKILNDANYTSLRTMDIINSRIHNLPEKEMEEKLEFLGRLLGFVNRLDISLVADNDIDKYYNAFKEQKYDVL